MAKSFDPKCGELAQYFLGDKASGRLVQELAAEIQQSIEDWLEYEKAKLLEADLRERGGNG